MGYLNIIFSKTVLVAIFNYVKASCICFGKSLFSSVFLGDFELLQVLKYLFFIFMGVSENL